MLDRALLSSALRHWNDSRRLLSDSPDQAFHLIGFAPECIRKALLCQDTLARGLGHQLIDGPLMEFVVALSPRLQRYPQARGWGDLHDWSPEVRYDVTGTHATTAAAAMLNAENYIFDVIAAAWADGLLPPEWEAC